MKLLISLFVIAIAFASTHSQSLNVFTSSGYVRCENPDFLYWKSRDDLQFDGQYKHSIFFANTSLRRLVFRAYGNDQSVDISVTNGTPGWCGVGFGVVTGKQATASWKWVLVSR